MDIVTRIWDTKYKKWAKSYGDRTIWFGTGRHIQTLKNLRRLDPTPGRYIVKQFELTHIKDSEE